MDRDQINQRTRGRAGNPTRRRLGGLLLALVIGAGAGWRSLGVIASDALPAVQSPGSLHNRERRRRAKRKHRD
jgi:hypothetical protein